MSEPIGQHAIQIAVHTLKDRCRNLQQRVTLLEEENLNLRVKCSRLEVEENTSLSEIDKFKSQIIELTEQKQQLQNKIKLVTNENQELWNKLSRLTVVNQNLGTQLNKISNSIIQHTNKNKETTSQLIRSKTFTQDEPYTKVLQRHLEENGKISTELEEISLKLINSFAQEKYELESINSDINNVNTSILITDSCSFFYDDNINEGILEQFHTTLDDIQKTKEIIEKQRKFLEFFLNILHHLKDFNYNKKELLDKATNTIEETSLDLEIFETKTPLENICPICFKKFNLSVSFNEYQTHVEKHFIDNTENY